jgi:hypothetical protein
MRQEFLRYYHSPTIATLAVVVMVVFAGFPIWWRHTPLWHFDTLVFIVFVISFDVFGFQPMAADRECDETVDNY